MLNDLKELIAIDSVMGEARDNAPFGTGPRKALDKFLEIAARYGMKAHDEHGYCGWAEIGEGKDVIGILGHLDVVPAGDGWSHNPFSLVCEDGMLYGRGVSDDKGPTVAALHALKSILDDGVKLRHRIRLIAGCNEENGSQCLEYYREHCEIPVASFVPDSDFPVINSEKGILHLSLTLPLDETAKANITSLTAGERANVVPDLCCADVPKGSALFDELASLGRDNSVFSSPRVATAIVNAGLRIEDFSVHFFENKLTLEARGVAGHAMCPDKGENAALKLIKLLAGLNSTSASSAINAVAKLLGAPNAAESLEIAAEDEVSGNLTVNTGVVRTENGNVVLTLDCRLPVCANSDEVTKAISDRFGGAKFEVLRWSPNLYIPESDKLVSALLDAYTETTGGERKCLSCGGGTYARELPNAVAFGATFPGLETNLHNADECFPVALFEKLPEIYKSAVLKLDKVF